ncbi:hypothetical protein SAMN04488063_1827 [Halopelagius inordinatus]|uniref:DUF7130 domain-containing protein n=1 Tax=Halopelagius inordinatus TaxID=553467 RepID=A0A1I2R838_9EURY|nr:hypothetical protein [Halopelagius inordinatus]SFG36885.1 hypothetical protein SAMN04488063_1827 [Halopelagius inordinatus]
MSSENDQSYVDDLLDGNKDEMEYPIGDVQDIETRSNAMWRCGECGEMGRIRDALPERCPGCDAAREELFYWVED